MLRKNTNTPALGIAATPPQFLAASRGPTGLGSSLGAVLVLVRSSPPHPLITRVLLYGPWGLFTQLGHTVVLLFGSNGLKFGSPCVQKAV